MKNAMTRVGPLFGSLLLLGVLLLGGGLARTAGAAPGPCTVDPGLPDPLYIELQTSLGTIEVELWPDVAPCTVNNFLAYVESGRYDGTFIHRSVDDFVIQAGGYAYDGGTDSVASIVRDPAVVNEPGESNLRATLAMARLGGQVNSATSEFFINLADNTFLDTVDEGFTVFGVVSAAGMSVADDIVMLPRVDGRWALNAELREIFAELPVLALPMDPVGGFGCFDPFVQPETGLSGWQRALLTSAGDALEPDPLTSGAYYLSTSCDGTGALFPPSVPCTTDREVAYRGNEWFLGATPMTCEQIAESDESLAARRDDHHPQVASNLVEITTVSVPEPSQGVLFLSALGSLYALALARSPK
jgi:cyclophilin family peptidyl-prolyl cis-trans isomerase